AEDELAGLQEKRDKINEIAGEFLNFATAVANPEAGWSPALEVASSDVGNTLKAPLFGGTLRAPIPPAREKIAAISERIENLEDSKVLTDIAAAAADLDAARKGLQAALEDLTAAVREAQTSQADLETDLKGLGPAGATAATALEQARETIATGN